MRDCADADVWISQRIVCLQYVSMLTSQVLWNVMGIEIIILQRNSNNVVCIMDLCNMYYIVINAIWSNQRIQLDFIASTFHVFYA